MKEDDDVDVDYNPIRAGVQDLKKLALEDSFVSSCDSSMSIADITGIESSKSSESSFYDSDSSSEECLDLEESFFAEDIGRHGETELCAVPSQVGLDSQNLTLTVKSIWRQATNLKEPESDLGWKLYYMARERVWTEPFQVAGGRSEPEAEAEPIPEQTSNINNEKRRHGQHYEQAMFLPSHGLVTQHGILWNNSKEYQDFAKKKGGKCTGHRDILFQSTQNYDKIMNDPEFSWCFDDFDYMENPSFGEQVIVDGCDASQLAIGDVFEVEGTGEEGSSSPLVLEITSPRKPCYYVNYRHWTDNGLEGMQRHTLTNALAGWFTRVVVAGELRDGMKLVRTKHPNPKWTLLYISRVLYGEGSRFKMAMHAATWNRDKSELEELISLPQLAEYEWKEPARKLLDEWDKNGTKLHGTAHRPEVKKTKIDKMVERVAAIRDSCFLNPTENVILFFVFGVACSLLKVTL